MGEKIMQLEEKLALIQQMRQHESLNSQRLGIRNERSYRQTKGEPMAAKRPDSQFSLFSSSFRLRFLLAILLFLLFFYMDIRSVSLGTVDSGQIQDYVSENLSLSSLSVLVDDIH